MDKTKLRRELLAGMCEVAEEITDYYLQGPSYTNLYFMDSETPEAFKPGVADKFLFNMIINDSIETVEKDLEREKLEDMEFISQSRKLFGSRILSRLFYPRYGTWIKLNRREASIRMFPNLA